MKVCRSSAGLMPERIYYMKRPDVNGPIFVNCFASMKKIQIIPFDKKKEAQIERDKMMTPAQRWEHMWELIELSISLSPNQSLKSFDQPDKFITLKRIR